MARRLFVGQPPRRSATVAARGAASAVCGSPPRGRHLALAAAGQHGDVLAFGQATGQRAVSALSSMGTTSARDGRRIRHASRMGVVKRFRTATDDSPARRSHRSADRMHAPLSPGPNLRTDVLDGGNARVFEARRAMRRLNSFASTPTYTAGRSASTRSISCRRMRSRRARWGMISNSPITDRFSIRSQGFAAGSDHARAGNARRNELRECAWRSAGD